MDKTILADKAMKRDMPTIMKINVKNAMTDAAKKKLEQTKKEGYTSI